MAANWQGGAHKGKTQGLEQAYTQTAAHVPFLVQLLLCTCPGMTHTGIVSTTPAGSRCPCADRPALIHMGQLEWSAQSGAGCGHSGVHTRWR